MTTLRILAVALAACLALSCSNSPYSESESGERVLYAAFSDAPRRLDVAEAYDVVAHAFTGLVHDHLLEYHYLERPYRLIPGLALDVPKAEPQPGGGVIYRFRMRRGVLFHTDPCFELAGPGLRTREATTRDIAFQLQRLADPALEVQVRDAFLNVVGLEDFMNRLGERRKADAAFARLPAHEQYAALGGIAGVRTPTPYELEVELSRPYPQILYWFALEFTSPIAWESVQYYDGEQGRPLFRDWAVGTGPFRLAVYRKEARVSFVKNESWWGLRAENPETAPAAFYPSEGEPGDRESGLLDPAFVGQHLPFLDRLEFRRDKESIPAFHKFLQGYYDRSVIIRESFDQVVRNDRISPEMAGKGVRLSQTVGPGWFYLGFNMEDPVVGAKGGDRARKLRQAMSLAVDSEQWIALFLNGRGVPAHSMIPPGLFGYEEDYRNPYRTVDLARARRLLAEAGYRDGIDPRTRKPLKLTFDVYITNTQQKLQDEYFANEWRKLGLDVELKATTYNEFQNKVQRLAYQVYFWGWSADYPDPENFLFLRSCDYRRSTVGGPNSTNFCDPRFERLFQEMRVRDDDERRLAAIREMRRVIEEERPHIEIYHPEDYLLVHGWVRNVKQFGMSNPMAKYYAVEPQLRAEKRAQWNRPVRWPAYAIGALLVVAMLPAFVAFFRERQ
jgi:ABC-type transport system substrate-binding protein